MKRKNSYILVLLALIIMNMPMSVSNVSAWEDSLAYLSKHALSQCMSIPGNTGDISISGVLNSRVLASAISSLEYKQGDSPAIKDKDPSPSDNSSTPTDLGDTSINQYENTSEGSILHNGNPKVLIYHTHTTESYLLSPDENPSSWRSTDSSRNLLSVGATVSEVLHNEYAIEVLHITDIHDQPYDTAYSKSYDSVEEAVKKYPSIEYIFDIHRDGLSDTDDNREVYLTQINGQDCARIMLVLSTKSSYIDEMRGFADEIKNKMEALYPTLYRRNMDRDYRYNMEFSPNSMLIELGSNLSTVSEAKATAVYLGRTIGEIIRDREAQ